MSEIPDEVVERVARAILAMIDKDDPGIYIGVKHRDDAEPYAWDKTGTIDGRVNMANVARAALRECGWAEMREALAHQVERTLSDGSPCFCSYPPEYGEHFSWCIEARSALSKAKGEGQ